MERNGLGRATAAGLAAAGADVVLADIEADAGRAAADEVGGIFVETDVSVPEASEAAVAFAVERFGGLDLAFLNAGVATGCGLVERFDPDLYRRAMGVNLDGVVFGLNAVVPALRERGGGAIVATSSLAGLAPVPFDPIYAANKHAVVGLARSMGPVLELEGIRFNAICPGFADTRIIEPIRDGLDEGGVPADPGRDRRRSGDRPAGRRSQRRVPSRPGRHGSPAVPLPKRARTTLTSGARSSGARSLPDRAPESPPYPYLPSPPRGLRTASSGLTPVRPPVFASITR